MTSSLADWTKCRALRIYTIHPVILHAPAIMASFLSGIFYLSTFVPRVIYDGLSGNNANEANVAGQSFDYIVVGGGLSGLTVANRLSEDSSREYNRWYFLFHI